jgi:hypothetical protein
MERSGRNQWHRSVATGCRLERMVSVHSKKGGGSPLWLRKKREESREPDGPQD